MSTLLKLMITTAAVVTLANPSNAGWIEIERPCGNKCVAPQPTQPTQPTIGMPFRRTGDGAVGDANYVSRSRTVIRSSYGTSVINSTYRSYSR